MKVDQQTMMEFLGQPDVQFVVPVYQRVYSWKEPQLSQLWDDIIAAGEARSAHFIGTVFYATEPSHHEGFTQLDVIDGQQRMTTLTLLMCAERARLEETGLTLDGLDAQALAERFLLIQTEDGPSCKLVLSRADAPTLRWIEGVAEKPESEEDYSELVVNAFEWFGARLADEDIDFDVFARGLECLYICPVLMEDQDRQQTVFESLNSKGLALSVPDLVRNFLLMSSQFEDRSYLYDEYWAPVEDVYAGDPDDRYLAHAIRVWTGRSAAIKDDHGIFEAFKGMFSVPDKILVEQRAASLAEHCINYHGKVTAGDEATIKECREWEENRGKAERIGFGRKIFGD